MVNSEDLRESAAERDASPVRFHEYPEPLYTMPRSQPGLSEPVEIQEMGNPRPIPRTGTQTSDFGAQPLRLRRTQTDMINSALERHPTALERIETHRLYHAATVGRDYDAFGRASRRPSTAGSKKSMKPDKALPDFGGGKPYPPPLPDQEEYVVEFNGPDDPLHPQNWKMTKKLYIGFILAMTSLCATMSSSIMSDSENTVAEIYGVSEEVGILITSLFVLGYCFGPIIWAPISELYGRKLPVLVSIFGFTLFSFAVATAENLQTVMICRFFAGAFGAAPLVLVAAVFSDMFNNELRGLAIAVFSATVFMGPLLAPFIGGFINMSYLGWRWTQYICGIQGAACGIACLLFLEETYPPVVLVSKASELRRRTKNWGIHAKQEEIEVNLKELAQKNLSRPFRILFTEPIVLLVTIYLSFIYGLLYIFLEAYAIVFEEIYGFNEGVANLPFFGLVVGVVFGFSTIVYLNKSYVQKLRANDNIPVPEWRLPITVFGGLIFAGGLFWFGWTSYQGTVPWIVPTISGIFTGYGIYVVFLQMLNYIIDGYLMFAASAIAANTIMRSLCGAGFPMFALYMFDGIGVEWTLTLLGCFALLLVVMPVVFLLYGKKIRTKSKIAPALDLKHEKEKREKDDLESGGSSDPNSEDTLAGSTDGQDAEKREEEEEEEHPRALEPVESAPI